MKHSMTERSDTLRTNHAASGRPAPRMTWVSETDARGRERLVARWSDPTMAQAASAAHAA